MQFFCCIRIDYKISSGIIIRISVQSCTSELEDRVVTVTNWHTDIGAWRKKTYKIYVKRKKHMRYM